MARTAKLSRPIAQRVLARAQLFRRLDGACRKPVVWIFGPPGAGKTTLVSSWLARRRRKCLWYSVDCEDGDLATFFYYAGRGLNGHGRRGREPMPLFIPAYALGAGTFARRFFRELCDRAPRPFAIVLDKFHELAADSPLLRVLPEALEEIPEGVCVVLVSRAEPPASFARLRANGMVEVVSADDLRLTTREAKAIVRLRGGAKLSEAEIARVNEQVRGWTAGLVLMLARRTPERHEDGPDAVTPQLVFDYFAGEVLDRADDVTRQVLLETALLPRVTEDVAARLTGIERAGAVLDELARRGYFTHRHDEPEGSYEYHPLFRRFLLARGDGALSGERLRVLRRNGAALLREGGQLEPAVDLLVRAEAWDDAANLILASAPALFQQGRGRALAAWIGQLPDSALQGRPWLLFWSGLSRLLEDPSTARGFLEVAFRSFERDRNAVGLYRTFAAVVDTYHVEWNEFGPLDHWIEAFERLRCEFPDFVDRETEARACSAVMSALSWRQPGHPSAAAYRQRLTALVRVSDDPTDRLRMAREVVVHDVYFGEFRNAATTLDFLRVDARSPPAEPLTVLIWRSLEAAGQWLSGQATAARETCASALALARTTGVHAWDFMLHYQATWAALLDDDLTVASDQLARMATASARDHRMNRCMFHHAGGVVERRRGNVPAAVQHGRAAVELADEAGSPLAQCFTRVTLATALLAHGEAASGLRELASARELAKRARSGFLLFGCLVPEALHHLRAGDEARAVQVLREAVPLSAASGFVVNPWLSRDEHATACAVSLEHGVEPEWAREIARRLSLSPPPGRSDAPGWPWPVEFRTLGWFEIRRNGEPVPPERRAQRRPAELVKLLVAAGPGRPLAEDAVADALWPDADGDASHHALEMTVHRARKLLGTDRAIVVREGMIALDERVCRVDAWAFEQLACEALAQASNGNPARAARTTARALAGYPGPFIAGDSMPAVVSYRERLEGFARRCRAIRPPAGVGAHAEP